MSVAGRALHVEEVVEKAVLAWRDARSLLRVEIRSNARKTRLPAVAINNSLRPKRLFFSADAEALILRRSQGGASHERHHH